MRLSNRRVVITGAARDLGRALAICCAQQGADVFLSARTLAGAERVRSEIKALGFDRVHAFACDLTQPDSIRAFAAAVHEHVECIDVLVNNGAHWVETADLVSASDTEISETLASGATGTLLMIKHFLPLLRASAQPDIVNLISEAALPNTHEEGGHPAFYAAKGAQGRLAEVLSHRFRPLGIRVISLYPPGFQNGDPLSAQWTEQPRTVTDKLTAQSLIECILFAVTQPRDCFIRSFSFEPI